MQQTDPIPEQINHSPDTAPSTRILRVCKVLDGYHIAKMIGLERMGQQCRHLEQYVHQMECLR
ncbi:DUF4276 family protein [Selenomonas bovis]|uniref:DUF4276 family protein n=1 Tax=Selenomonas bovis TaxID=416586 RepID=UPI0039C6AE9B